MKIVSWNVNGIAACREHGFLKFLKSVKPDMVCCQEVKSKIDLSTPGYLQYWNKAKEPGYAGTLILTKYEPISVTNGFGIKKLDGEGRIITLEYQDYYVLNVYVPSIHTYSAPDRPDFRLAWDKALRKYISKLDKPVILCGDFNATAAYIDTYPTNQKNEPDNPLFTSETRDSIVQLKAMGLVDAFRALYPDKEADYTWWGPKDVNRVQNHGSRLDYFFLSGELVSGLQEVTHHADIFGSDHCPISMIFNLIQSEKDISDEDLATIWRTIDWGKMNQELRTMQEELAQAAFERDWRKVSWLQDKLLNSWPAKVLAVKEVADADSVPGVDGVLWITDVQKAKAAKCLTLRDYYPLPNRYGEIGEHGKKRKLLISTVRDRAVQTLLKYALKPVSESTADNGSFFSREGRSMFDARAYLERNLEDERVMCVVVVDAQSFYGHIVHEWCMKHIPLPESPLRKILKAGCLKNGVIFDKDEGISLASPLSPIIGNMVLDGLQSYIYDRLYPKGGTDHINGSMVRFLDDIVVTARSRQQAELIMQIVTEFLAERGAKPNPTKSYVACITEGFDYLGRHYQRKNGVLEISASTSKLVEIEQTLKSLIQGYKGTIRHLIEKVNYELTKIYRNHRAEDSYMLFRHIDAFVTGLFLERMCAKRPKWHQETIRAHFFVRDGDRYIFVLPQDRTVRIMQLAPLPIKKHTPCKIDFNPFLDKEYYAALQYQREIQKTNGNFKSIWDRQDGRCAYCGQPMLPDQDVEIIEKLLGQGHRIRNLAYIHKKCSYDTSKNWDMLGVPVDLAELLEDMLDDTPDVKSPYLELTRFFRRNKRTTIHLTFKDIEEILGDKLPWEAYFFESFWYDATSDITSLLWKKEDFPAKFFCLTYPHYDISQSWRSQGYEIKSLHMETDRVVFRKEIRDTEYITVPKALTNQPLPEHIAYEFHKLITDFMQRYGL